VVCSHVLFIQWRMNVLGKVLRAFGFDPVLYAGFKGSLNGAV